MVHSLNSNQILADGIPWEVGTPNRLLKQAVYYYNLYNAYNNKDWGKDITKAPQWGALYYLRHIFNYNFVSNSSFQDLGDICYFLHLVLKNDSL